MPTCRNLKKAQRELTHTRKNNKNTFKTKSVKSEIWQKIDYHDKHDRQ